MEDKEEKHFEFNELGLPKGVHIPDEYSLIEAYTKDGEIVVPIRDIPENKEHLHDCDVEGCGTFSHVVRFRIEWKYEADLTQTNEDTE